MGYNGLVSDRMRGAAWIALLAASCLFWALVLGRCSTAVSVALRAL